MSKNNRANRARKQKAAAQRNSGKSRPITPPMPWEFAALANNPEGRRRFAMLLPFLYLANKNPYTPGMSIPDGSLIIGRGTPQMGYIPAHHVQQVIAETMEATQAGREEIITAIAKAVASGLIEFAGELPPMVAQAAESAG